jgi:hypothetical protein
MVVLPDLGRETLTTKIDCLQKAVCHIALTHRPRRMGPRFRGGDKLGNRSNQRGARTITT